MPKRNPTIPTKTSLIAIDMILEQAGIEAGSVAADLGCGRSLFFLYALSQLAGQKGMIYGIDVLPEVIESAQRDIAHHKLEGIAALRANLEAPQGVPLADGSLDAAFLINTLHQSHNTLAMLTETVRLIKPGGRLVIAEWDAAPSPIGPNPVQRLAREHVLEMLEMLGAKKIDTFPAGLYHYGIRSEL